MKPRHMHASTVYLKHGSQLAGIEENGTNSSIQWNLSITDTLRREKQFAIQRFSQFRGCFTYRAIYLVPPKQFVIERFLLLGEFVVRGSTIYDVRSINSDNVNFFSIIHLSLHHVDSAGFL